MIDIFGIKTKKFEIDAMSSFVFKNPIKEFVVTVGDIEKKYSAPESELNSGYLLITFNMIFKRNFWWALGAAKGRIEYVDLNLEYRLCSSILKDPVYSESPIKWFCESLSK